MRSQLDLIVSKSLREHEEGIIESGATDLLSWFCQLPPEQIAWEGVPTNPGVLSSARNAVSFGEQPCIGVASEDDKPVAGSVYYSDNRNQAMRVAAQAVQSLNGTLEWMRGRSVWKQAFSPQNEDSCCRRVFFMPHPVFGVMYRMRIPLGPGDYREVCYRRRWLPRPLVKPLSQGANMTDLFQQSKLSKGVETEEAIEEEEREESAVPEEDKKEEQAEIEAGKEATEQAAAQGTRRRSLADAEGAKDKPIAAKKPKNWGRFVKQHVVAVLPYRARHLHRLPNLLKSFARMVGAKNPKDSPGVSAELVIVPVETRHVELDDAPVRLTSIVDSARSALGIDVKIQPVVAATPEDMMKDLAMWSKGRRGTGQGTDDKNADDDDDAGVNKGVKNQGKDVTSGDRTEKRVSHMEQEVLQHHIGKLVKKIEAGQVDKKVQARLDKWMTKHGQGTLQALIKKAKEDKAAAVAKAAEGKKGRRLSDESMLNVLASSQAVQAYYTGLMASHGQDVNVVLLDSSLSNLPVTLARKATWRVVGGRQVYAPIAQANQVASDDDDGQQVDAMLSHGALDRLDDGGVLESKLPTDSGVGSEAWWKQAPAGFDKSRRARGLAGLVDLGAVHASEAVAPSRVSVLRAGAASGARRLEGGEGEGEDASAE